MPILSETQPEQRAPITEVTSIPTKIKDFVSSETPHTF